MPKIKKRRGGDIDNIYDTKEIDFKSNPDANIYDIIMSMSKIDDKMKLLINNINDLENSYKPNKFITEIVKKKVNYNSMSSLSPKKSLINGEKKTKVNYIQRTASAATLICTSKESCDNLDFNPEYKFFDCIKYFIRKYNKSNKIFNENYIELANNQLFSYFKLYRIENEYTYITIDPLIIQLMIFDKDIEDDDIVYSLKIIYKNNKIYIRYTNKLFPKNTLITDYNDMTEFNNYNINLNNEYILKNYKDQFKIFLIKYINLYNFYKKCFISNEKKFIDYPLKYISILGKARFFNKNLQIRCKKLSEYLLSNIIFINPMTVFISGGYKGFGSEAYGITRSGYEISKQFNRPVLTIMCSEGLSDSHQYSDATLIYGEHWGEDTIALSQFNDAAIIIAPFGGWTYIECLCNLKTQKIIAIYNGNYNILNYNSNKDNIFFFYFNHKEQCSIINYYLNYYLLIFYILNKKEIESPSIKLIKNELIKLIKLLYIFIELINLINEYRLDIINDVSYINSMLSIIEAINHMKNTINDFIEKKIKEINIIFKESCNDEYQATIPLKCNGLWIKPKYNLNEIFTNNNISLRSILKEDFNNGVKLFKDPEYIYSIYEEEVNIDIEAIQNHKFFKSKNINHNIIYVFSNVVFMGIYINDNLNGISYNKKLNTKINQLSELEINGKKIKDYCEEYNTIKVNRNLDGYLDENGDINQDIIKNEDNFFIVKEECKNI
jgi:hypothetical protein